MAPSALDGDGWINCQLGHQHWGRHGAAGLLLRTTDSTGVVSVLLQRRAWWTHHGGTWGVPGGARASWETPAEAAFRELGEEVVLSPEIDRIHHDDHGGWAYWTIIASIRTPLKARPRGHETAEMRWVEVEHVNLLELHPGFATTWPQVSG
jgi:8-oxo-dGTP diphosphatase